MLAYSVMSNDDYIEEEVMLNILKGTVFQTFNIENFVDNDFFYWVSDGRNFHKLKKVFRLISQELSAFDFDNVNEDILKGVYQELIDIDTRQQLGEYYTPDWLCERIVKEFDFDKCKKILDPSCGSGSFLRAAIQRIKHQNPEKTPDEINNQIYGIDIHPLSVQIAKTTVLLALGKDVKNARKPVVINILLANTLYSPINENTLFGEEFLMPIDRNEYKVNSLILNNISEFNKGLEVCDQLSSHGTKEKPIDLDNFTNILDKHITTNAKGLIANSYYEIYKGLRTAKEEKRDSIWKFIISNQYKPYFLYEFFDYIIGNPPWFTYKSIKNEAYQNVINNLATKYDVKPQQVANYANLEIAAIFLSHCSSYFLKEDGKMAFVLPRSFFSGDQHDRTRSGAAKGFKLTEIWDLDKVKPLFNIPSCVFFTEKIGKQNGKPSIINGKQFEGRLPAHNCHYNVAETYLNEIYVEWYLKTQGKATAFSTNKNNVKNVVNPYRKCFKKGATITPRAFYFIDFNQEIPKDFIDRVINIKTSANILLDAKAPWKISLKGQVESKFIFRTAISKSILPFYLHNPAWITLPITIEKDNDGLKKIKLYTSEELMNAGELKAWRWFANTETIWNTNKTEKSKNMSTIDRIDFQKGLSSQNLNIRYLVMYTASAKDANTVVFDRTSLNFDFFADAKTYLFQTDNENEAHYLSSVLNSSKPNLLMKDFQTRGLFGPRDVSKKILDVYFPKFNELNKKHLQLSNLGKICAEKVKVFVENNPPQQDLTAHFLGKMRLDIKKHLSKEMVEIDKIVEKL